MAATDLKNAHAGRIFDGIADSYEGPARVLSLFQYGRWHRYLLSRLELCNTSRVLDVGTGTGMVAGRITGNAGCEVVGLDLSGRMIEHALRNLRACGAEGSVGLVRGRAESLPFEDRSFDCVVFTFLLRYVADPQATLCELSRVLRPGGQMVSLEFFVPQNAGLRVLWLLHTRLAMPLGARFLSQGWRVVGSFLGPSISAFYREHTLEELSGMWEAAGVVDVEAKVLSFGSAVVTRGRKEDDREK